MSRIAFISALEGVPWGGSEELWSRAAVMLHARGHEAFANTHWWPEKPAKLAALESAGVLLTRRRFRERNKLLDQTVLRGRLSAKIYQWLDAVAPELVVISLDSQSAGADWMEACRERHLPYVLVVQAVIEHLWPGDASNEPLARGYENARKIYCVSKGNRHWLQTQFAQQLPQAEVIWNPFNVSSDANPAWPDDRSTLRLACVGRLDAVAKGQDILFRVLQKQKWKERAVAVSLVGAGGYEQSLRRLAEFCELKNVSFVPFTTDIENIWRSHHALVLPSRFEGFPLVVLEAMLCGRACLVTDVAGNAELIADNVSGFIAKAPTVEFVDEALERLWQSWQNRTLQSCGQNAANTIRKHVPENPAQLFSDKLEQLLTKAA